MLARNVASNYAGFAVRSLVTLILTPFLVHRLGDAAFGLWVLLNAILEYFQLAEIGIPPSIIRHVSLHRARAEHDQVDSMVSSGLAVLLALSVLSLPAIWALSRLGPRWFDLDPSAVTAFAGLAWLIGATGVLAYFMRMFHAVIEGHQRFDLLNLSSASSAVLGALATVWVVNRGGGLTAIVAVLLAQTAYRTAIEALIALRCFGIKPGWRRVNWDSLRRLLDYSRYAFLIDVAVSIAWRIDALVIGIFLPVSQIAYYAIGTRMAGVLGKMIDPLIDTFFPLASRLHTTNDDAALRRLLLDGTRGTVLVVTPVLVLAAARGADLIRLWVGESYVQASLPVLHVFLAVMFLSVLESTSARILLGIGQVRFDAGVSLVSGVANLVLSMILVQRYGLVGVAWGTLIPSVVGNFFVSVPYTCRLTGTPLVRFYARVLLPALAVALTSLLFMALTHQLIGHAIGSLVVDLLFASGLAAIVLFRSIDVRQALALGTPSE